MCVALFSYYYFDHRTHIVYRLIKNYTQLQFTVSIFMGHYFSILVKQWLEVKNFLCNKMVDLSIDKSLIIVILKLV